MGSEDSSTKGSFRKLFEDLGYNVENDAVLNKCVELCKNYVDLDMEKLMELWVNFCVDNNFDIDPIIGNLNEMEHKVLMMNYTAVEKTTKEETVKKTKRKQDTMEKQYKCRDAFSVTIPDDVLSIYGCAETGSSLKHPKKISLEAEINTDAQASEAGAVENSFSSASYVENLSIPSQRNTTNKEKILFFFGETVTSWKRTGDYDVEVTKASEQTHISSEARYMYEKLSTEGQSLTSVCQTLGSKLLDAWRNITTTSELRYVKNVRSVSQTNFRTFGRISTNKGVANTVTLEGSTKQKGASSAPSIALDFRDVEQYSVFSGQIVAVEAINPIGDVLYVKELFTTSYAPYALMPIIKSRINIFVAAGPFTAFNNMNYQPLWDLMEKVASDEPQLLILIGPLLEYTHPDLQNNTSNDTYREQYEIILTKIMKMTRNRTQVVVVASNRDAHNEPIYPTHAYTIKDRKLLNYTNLKVMPDPCILDVESLKIGITSVDVIKHIGREEISNMPGDRLRRLANHVLSQGSFYPVYPPDEDLNVDTGLWEQHTFFNQQPHLLILPSDMRCFCKVINECMVLNPERMHKNTYARLSVKPNIGNVWSSNNISCEIVKV